MMSKFMDALRKSTIIAGVVSLLVVGTTCYLWATSSPVPPELLSFDTMIMSYWLMAKLANQPKE